MFMYNVKRHTLYCRIQNIGRIQTQVYSVLIAHIKRKCSYTFCGLPRGYVLAHMIADLVYKLSTYFFPVGI